MVEAGRKSKAMGVVNGYTVSVSALAHAIGPILAATAWGWSVGGANRLLPYGLEAWALLLLIVVFSWFVSLRLPDEVAPGRRHMPRQLRHSVGFAECQLASQPHNRQFTV